MGRGESMKLSEMWVVVGGKVCGFVWGWVGMFGGFVKSGFGGFGRRRGGEEEGGTTTNMRFYNGLSTTLNISVVETRDSTTLNISVVET